MGDVVGVVVVDVVAVHGSGAMTLTNGHADRDEEVAGKEIEV